MVYPFCPCWASREHGKRMDKTVGQRILRGSLLLMVCPWLALQGCEADPFVRSQITLRTLVSVEIEPPEARPGESIQVKATVADPEVSAGSLEWMLVACTAYTGVIGCLEEVEVIDDDDVDPDTGDLNLDDEDIHELVEQFVVRGETFTSALMTQTEASFQAPLNDSLLLTELEATQLDKSLLYLVCNAGTCPIMAEVDAFLARAPGAPTGAELLASLSDPALLTAGAPLEGVAVGRKSYKVSLRSDRNRNHTPRLEGFDASTCAEHLMAGTLTYCQVQVQLPAESLEIYQPDPDSTLQVQEGVAVRFYTTLGELSPFSVQVYPSSSPIQTATLSLSAEVTAARLALFAVAVDTRGGMSAIGTELLTPEDSRAVQE